RAAEPEPTQVAVEAPPPSRRRWLLIAAGALAVVVAGVVAWRLAPVREVSAPSSLQTIAILPFKPVVANPRDEAMKIGMADSLIMELSRSPKLIVRPLSATRRFVALDQDPVDAG